MSEFRDAKRDQPEPKQGIQNVTDAVIADLKERTEFGTRKYGRPLETHNGRDALLDAYQEAVDLALYLKQAVLEGKPNKYIAGIEWAAKAQDFYGGACGGGKSSLLTAKAETDADKHIVASLARQLDEMRWSRDSYVAAFRGVQEKVAAGDRRIADYGNAVREARDEAKRLQENLSERDATIANLTKELNNPHRTGDAAQYWREQTDKATKRFADLEDRRLGLADELKAAQDSIQSLRKTLTETEDRRLNSQKLVGELRASIAERDTRITNFAKDVANYKANVADRNAQIASLASLLRERKSEVASLMATYERTINERDRARKDVDILTEENGQLRKDAAHRELVIDNLIKDTHNQRSTIEEIRAERDAAVKKAASHDKVFSDCSDRINDLIGRNDTLREKLAARNKEFESLRVLSSKVINELSKGNGELRSRINELTSVKIVVEGGTIRSGNTEWTIKSSKPTCPDGYCVGGGPCPCYPNVQS